MNAEEAKKAALANKSQMEENLKIRAQKAVNADVALLYNHFHNKIEDAVASGHLKTDELSFPADRFSNDIINDVSTKLREEGYNLSMSKHNAFQKVGFTISWT